MDSGRGTTLPARKVSPTHEPALLVLTFHETLLLIKEVKGSQGSKGLAPLE